MCNGLISPNADHIWIAGIDKKVLFKNYPSMSDIIGEIEFSIRQEENIMLFSRFRCQGCGWDMKRLVPRYVMEIKCPICGNTSQKQMTTLTKEN
jgi:hypothetical protein